MKKEYSELEIEIIRFQSEDVITTSCPSQSCSTETEPMPAG